MLEIRDAILAGQFDAVGSLDVPDHYRGVTVHADEAEMFTGIPSRCRDLRGSFSAEGMPANMSTSSACTVTPR